MKIQVEFKPDSGNTVIATFEGYNAPPTAEGVSGATTRTVVTSALMILALDLVLTAFMLSGYD